MHGSADNFDAVSQLLEFLIETPGLRMLVRIASVTSGALDFLGKRQKIKLKSQEKEGVHLRSGYYYD